MGWSRSGASMTILPLAIFTIGAVASIASTVSVLIDNRRSIMSALRGEVRHYHTTHPNRTHHTTTPPKGGIGGVWLWGSDFDQTKQTTPHHTITRSGVSVSPAS